MRNGNGSEIAQFNQGRTATGQLQVLRGQVYDHLTYAAAGQAELNFFQQQRGQGVSVFNGGAGPKTYSDTNLKLSGQLSAGEAFLCEALSFHFISGVYAVQETVSAAVPAVQKYAAQDAEIFWEKSGAWVEVQILEKTYPREPVNAYPSVVRNHIEGFASNMFTLAAAANQNDQITASLFQPIGMVKTFEGSGLTLEAGLSFQVRLMWPGAVALPSGQAGIVRCAFHGRWMQLAQ